MGKWLDEALRIRPVIEQAAASLDDASASKAPSLFRTMTGDGSPIPAGTRICWNGALKRAAVDLWDVQANSPDNAPALWEDVAYKDGYRLIPEIITATLAFALDEPGWWQGRLYRSLRDGNVHTPAAAPECWEAV